MAGIYVHIPFCKSRCIYCGFFSTTLLQKRHEYVDAVVEELRQRRTFLVDEPVDTIYFGGGTPSQLPPDELERILVSIYNIYNVRENAEVTLEGNPDDMTPALLYRILQMGINRLSMGIQTFDEACIAVIPPHKPFKLFMTHKMLVSPTSASTSCLAFRSRRWMSGSPMCRQHSPCRFSTCLPIP